MIAVKLYGHPTSTYEYIKMKLKRIAHDEGIDYSLEEINKFEDFVKDGVESIPSIMINDFIKLNLDSHKELEDYISEIRDNMISEEYNIKKREILVPTDFSVCAANALQFALHLSKLLHAKVHVMHAYNPTGATAEGVLYFDSELESIRRDQLRDFTQSGLDMWRNENSYPVKTIEDFRIGFVVPATKEIVDEDDEFLVVIGSTGGSASFKKFFGSVTTELAAKVQSPIFIIPENVAYKPIKKVAYACDVSNLDVKAIQDIISILGELDPELHLVHVQEKNENYPTMEVQDAIKMHYPKSKVTCHIIEGEDVVSTINQFVEGHDIDLVAVARGRRGFLNTLFHKSVTKAMSIKTNVPLLVIHK